ncbi:hypothetical protein AB0N81_40380 [Streptomyces sp. NPDC093510]|uniref:hypothetical protein n=1 Tax=Streptomyces sp. NPDC093510 TaxID=3155199 RepID=UPI00341CD3C3
MKTTLWLVLLLALAANIASIFIPDSLQQALISVPTGLTALAAGIALALKARKRRAGTV